jgi:hypothetical protein
MVMTRSHGMASATLERRFVVSVPRHVRARFVLGWLPIRLSAGS